MMDADLPDGEPEAFGSGEDLRIDERPHRLELDLLEQPARKELEHAVDIGKTL